MREESQHQIPTELRTYAQGSRRFAILKTRFLLTLVAVTFSLSAQTPCPPQPAKFGLTILAHGYGSGPEGWLSEMATAINNAAGGGIPTFTIRIVRNLREEAVLAPDNLPIDITSVGSAIVITNV